MNSAGNATQRFRLNVGVPPRITEEPKIVTVTEGSQARIPCEAVGVPEPTIMYASICNGELSLRACSLTWLDSLLLGSPKLW